MNELRTESEILNSWEGDCKTPKVSICCITYNHELYIEDALKGFLKQETNFPYEVLVHDDASPDSTAEIIKRYSRKYPNIIKPMYQKENQLSKGGIHPNLEFNYPRAKGEYIALCDGDDYWTESRKLSKQINFLENNRHYIGTAHNVKVIDENGFLVENKMHPYRKLPNHTFSLKDAEKFELAGQTSTLVYRNIWKDIDNNILDLYKSCKTTGDKKLALLLAIYNDVYYFSETMANHRKILSHGTSWSAKVAKKNMSLYRYKELISVKEFAYEAFGISINNKRQRMTAFYNAFTYFLKDPDKANWFIIKEIIRLNYDGKIVLLLSLPIYIVTWPVRRIKRRMLDGKQ